MTNATHEGGPLPAVLEDLAASRGLTLADVADRARRAGHDLTPHEIVNGLWSFFGDAVDVSLSLDADERARVRRAVVHSLIEGRGEPVPGPGLVAPGLSRYRPPNPREDGGPFCSVSHPDAGGRCPGAAVGEVWSIAFCGLHLREAEAAALAELREDAEDAAREVLDANRPRWQVNGALLEALRAAGDLAREEADAARMRYEDVAGEVYGGLPDSATDPETLAFDGDYFAGGPALWWGESRRAVVRAMREAYEAGLPALLGALEPLRERHTAQEVLAVRYELSGPPAQPLAGRSPWSPRGRVSYGGPAP